jgi:tRNA threonylcarbamoyladenosine biosynthesis protein TsaB
VIVLGFDTATPATAVGLRLADGTTLLAHDDPGVGERPGHVTRLLPLAAGLLEQAGLDWSALQRIAVGVGPGTFTGLRIGVASARGLAQSLAIEVVGVSTLRTLAKAALEVADAKGEGVLAVIDARRGEAFAGAYVRDGELIAPRALAPGSLGALLESGREREPQIGWLAVGDGAVRFREYLEDGGAVVPADRSPLHRVDARAICALALDVPIGVSAPILPDYLRRPDAEIALEGAER